MSASLFAAVIPVRAHAVFVKDEYLAGEYIALEFCADGGERTALGRDDICAVERLAVAQRAEPVRSRAASSFAADMSTREYAPSSLFIALLSAFSIEGLLRRACVTI